MLTAGSVNQLQQQRNVEDEEYLPIIERQRSKAVIEIYTTESRAQVVPCRLRTVRMPVDPRPVSIHALISILISPYKRACTIIGICSL
jgi:hypothetical protein